MIRIERLELFDEFEEWHMMQASNALIPAMKDSKLLLLINKMIWFRSAHLYQIVISSHTHTNTVTLVVWGHSDPLVWGC